MTTDMIKDKLKPLVYIVDDDFAVRDSLQLFLESAGLEIESYESGREFFKHYDPSRISCLLLDVFMPGMSGHDIHARLVKLHSTTPILFMSGHATINNSVTAFKAGALDFIEKPFDMRILLDKITEAFARDVSLKVHACKQEKVREQLETLTDLEDAVLMLVLKGLSTKRVAKALSMSVHEVEEHKSSLKKKLNVTSLTRLVAKVLPIKQKEREDEAESLYRTFLTTTLIDEEEI